MGRFGEALGRPARPGRAWRTRARREMLPSESQQKPCSPFGKDDYQAYYARKKKYGDDIGDGPSPEWEEFEADQWGRSAP